MDDNIVPVMGILIIFGLPVAGWIIKMSLAHKERMAMIQAGMHPQTAFDERAAGPINAAPWQMPATGKGDCGAPSLSRGIMLTSVGFALFIGLSFIGYSPSGGFMGGPQFTPGPWLLGGLIPMFVGIARIITALLAGAQLNGYNPQQAQQPRPSGSRPYGQQPYPPYARPVNPKVEELKRPGTPPAEQQR